jgi:peroxiredoxin
MTQLVQLQTVAAKLAERGFSVFAISNDPVEVLAEFSAEHGITYPLLSDADSAVIRSFGIMNQLIQPEEGRSMGWYGIPYPGTYYLDADGIVADKDFHQHHSRRASGNAVLARALGGEVEVETETVAVSTTDEVGVSAGLADPTLQLELITQLIIDFDIPAGRHIYAPGAPEAFTPLSVDVSGPGIRAEEPTWPAAAPLTMSELGLTCPTYEGRVRLAVPITITSEAARLGHELAADSVVVSIVAKLQSCDETTCGLPKTVSLELTVNVERLVEPEGLGRYAERVEAIEAERGDAVR